MRRHVEWAGDGEHSQDSPWAQACAPPCGALARAPAHAPRKRPRAALQQRHYDVIGLALIAAGVFLGFVIYGHWDGGRVGDWLARGLASLIGQTRLGVPVACAGAGALFVMRPAIPTIRPFRAGRDPALRRRALALAVGGPAHVRWAGAGAHGGSLGEAELWAAASLIGTAGAQILAGFLALAGVFLVSGGALGAAVRAGGTRLARSARTRRPRQPARPAVGRVTPPEPSDRELVVRATHVEAPPIEPPFRSPISPASSSSTSPIRRTFASCTTSRPSSCRCPSPSS